MSTQPYQPEPIQHRPTTTPDSTTSTRPPTDRAPATFSTQTDDRLQNLIDEWNAAFAPGE